MRNRLFLLVLLWAPAIAFAQETNPADITRPLMPLILAAMFAYVTRRKAIGGWLFYFYLNKIVGAAVLSVMAVATFKEFGAEGWDRF